MYRFIEILIVVFCFGFGTSAQSLIGAWEGYSTSAGGEKLRNMVIFSDGFDYSLFISISRICFVISTKKLGFIKVQQLIYVGSLLHLPILFLSQA